MNCVVKIQFSSSTIFLFSSMKFFSNPSMHLSLVLLLSFFIDLFSIIVLFCKFIQAMHVSFWQLLHSILCKAIISLLDGATLSALCWMQSMDMQREHLIKVSPVHVISHPNWPQIRLIQLRQHTHTQLCDSIISIFGLVAMHLWAKTSLYRWSIRTIVSMMWIFFAVVFFHRH